MTKNLIKSAVITLFIPLVVFAESPNQTPSASPVKTNAPVVSASLATDSSPKTSNSNSTANLATSNSTAAVSNSPSTGNSGSTSGPVTSNSSATVTNPTPTPETPIIIPNNPSNNGNSYSGGSSSSSSGRRSVNNYSCNTITSYMKYGANNDRDQVIKLQTFLKDVEKLSVDINGVFDKKTENAVKTFQNKYSATVMGPWKASEGTGFVYITTIKQINKIACNQPLTLNSAELAIINSSNKKINSSSNNAVIVSPNKNTVSEEIKIKETKDNTITFESNEKTDDNVATVTKSSIMNRFWKFLIYLFK